MFEIAKNHLKSTEWAMGNGQCATCYGKGQTFYDGGSEIDKGEIGHEPDCAVALALVSLGDTPIIKGKFESEIEWEMTITERGFIGSRHKTPDGCPRWKAHCKEMCESLSRSVLEAINSRGKHV